MSSGVNPNDGPAEKPPESTSPSLLQRVKALRPDAWRRLVRLYGPVAYVWARKAGLSPEDASDVVQEVFVSVAAHVEGFRHDRPGSTFRGWLWTIARNKIRDHFRRGRGRAQAQGGTDAQMLLSQVPDPVDPSSEQPAPAPDGLWIAREALELIRDDFEERTWKAFLRATIQGESSAAIAADLGMTKRAVRQAKYRVLKRLREEFEGLLD